jgi:hypothetical protein
VEDVEHQGAEEGSIEVEEHLEAVVGLIVVAGEPLGAVAVAVALVEEVRREEAALAVVAVGEDGDVQQGDGQSSFTRRYGYVQVEVERQSDLREKSRRMTYGSEPQGTE